MPLPRLVSLRDGLLRRRRLEREMDAELRFHLERRAADLVASGLTAAEARRRAHRELGAVEGIKVRCREARGLRWADELAQDLRYSIRSLRLAPGFAAAAVLTLALGIGVNATVFSLFDAILSRPLPYAAPARLVREGSYFPKGVSREVVGVMPAGFAFPSAAARLWLPARLDPGDPVDLWKSTGYGLLGRLRDGITLAQAQEELRRLIPRVRDAFPWRMPDEWNMGQDNRVLPLQEWMTAGVRPRLLVVLGAAWLVLLVACADVANLLLARAAVRQREIALRAAFGGGRRRILKQVLTESVVLAAAGGIAGLALAALGVPLLKSVLPGDTPRLAAVSLDWRALVFAGGLAVATGIACGMLPALRLLGAAGPSRHLLPAGA